MPTRKVRGARRPRAVDSARRHTCNQPSEGEASVCSHGPRPVCVFKASFCVIVGPRRSYQEVLSRISFYRSRTQKAVPCTSCKQHGFAVLPRAGWSPPFLAPPLSPPPPSSSSPVTLWDLGSSRMRKWASHDGGRPRGNRKCSNAAIENRKRRGGSARCTAEGEGGV